MKKLFPFLFFLFVIGFLSPLQVELRASVDEIGSYFRINTNTYNNQTESVIAAIDSGSFVVVWTSLWQDGTIKSVYGQRFNSSGAKLGTEFKVNTYATDSQYAPSIAGLSEGGFVVIWASWGQDGSMQGIYGQRFNSSGTKAGNEFQVNTYTYSSQVDPSVVSISDGGFLVIWVSYDQDGSGSGIYGQRFNNSGDKVGNEFQVNTYTTQDQDEPSVAILSDGGFVVTWTSYGQDEQFGDGVYGQRFDSSGAKAGNEFQVNTYTQSSQKKSSVAPLSDGKFIVIWESWYQDGDFSGIYGQLFDSSSAKIGIEFQVNTHTTDRQGEPSVSTLFGEGFLALWISEDYPDNYGCYGQLFDTSGNKVFSEFEAYYLPADKKISVEALSSTVFVVVADSGFDGDNDNVEDIGIVGQIFEITPVANFSATPTSGNASLSVTFTDLSTGNPTSWSWDFDNNGTEDSTAQNPVHTYTSPGNYSVSLTVTGLESTDTETKIDYITVNATVPEANVNLYKGWNLISLNNQPSDMDITTVLESIYDKYISVWAYIDGSWKVYDPNNPGFSDLTTMEAGKGYWINMKEAATLSITGAAATASCHLTKGWNLVGYNSSTSQSVTDALASIAGKYVSLWAYVNGSWRVYDPNNPGFSDLTTMEPGYGYWINTTEACTWTLL